MQAVVYSETGGPEVLRLIERPEPAPGPGEVTVEIRRSGVNPTDVKSRQGGKGGKPVEPAQVPGQDGAGVVVAVGEGVDASLRGQRVWIWEAAYQRPEGTTQQITTVPVRQVVPLPDTVSFDVGAGLAIPFITAHRCLTVGERTPRRLGPGSLSGHTVLVAGGAGAVGNAAIQLARWSDALVITTVSSPAKAQLAAAAGADHIINYREEDVAAEIAKIAPEGVDLVVEVAIATNAAIDTKVLRNGGYVASYANDGGSEVTLDIRALMTKNVRVQFVLVYTAPLEAKRHAIDDITRALVAGEIGVGEDRGIPLHHFPLERAGEAHRAVEAGATGKVLIDVTD